MIIAERAARVEAEAVAARAQAVNTSTEVLIAHLKLEIEKLRRTLYGSRSEHTFCFSIMQLPDGSHHALVSQFECLAVNNFEIVIRAHIWPTGDNDVTMVDTTINMMNGDTNQFGVTLD